MSLESVESLEVFIKKQEIQIISHSNSSNEKISLFPNYEKLNQINRINIIEVLDILNIEHKDDVIYENGLPTS
jgi:hypothetical protein